MNYESTIIKINQRHNNLPNTTFTLFSVKQRMEIYTRHSGLHEPKKRNTSHIFIFNHLTVLLVCKRNSKTAIKQLCGVARRQSQQHRHNWQMELLFKAYGMVTNVVHGVLNGCEYLQII